MSLSAIAVLAIATALQSGIPEGHADFDDMSDRQIAEWLENARFFHATNVFRCQGLRHRDADRELAEALGHRFEARTAAIDRELARRYGTREDRIFILTGYRTTRRYCRNIRYVVTDLLRGTSELERRLEIRR